MGHVEEAGPLTHRLVLFLDRRILHGHLEPAEGHHAGAGFHVLLKIGSSSVFHGSQHATGGRPYDRLDCRCQRSPSRASAARQVFSMSMAMVMGPTPPGTGVIAPA